MGTVTERYDRHALRYGRWWAPVLEPTALRLLETVAPVLRGGEPARIVDVGTGTGVLALAAASRWPAASVVGVDGSAAMLAVARRTAQRRLTPAEQARVDWRTALADRLPWGPGEFDLAVSSFVLQLVPDRLRVLREVHRILRPGGLLAYVTWLDAEDGFVPQSLFDELADEESADAGVEPEAQRSGDPVSAAAAAAQLRRAGFRRVGARADWLEYRWTARSYLDFLEHYDAADLFESLEPRSRARLRARTAAAFATLSPEAFAWRTPVVFAIAKRPAA